MFNTGILVFNDVEELDFIGPFETMSYINKIRPESTKVFTISENGGEIRCFNGLKVLTDYSVETCPELDILIVPGGKGRIKEMKNGVLLEFIKLQDRSTKYTASVCTGAFLLANAGLLAQRKATTYHTAFEELAEYGIDVQKSKVVCDGKYVTSAGVSSGIELGLYLIRELFGLDNARDVASKIEYEVDVEKL